MQKTNVNTRLAIAFIAVAVMLVGGGLGATTTTTSHTTTLQKAFALPERPNFVQGSDRCVTFQFSNGDAAITCIIPTNGTSRKLTNERFNELKNDCQEAQEKGLVDECRYSQTGNGVFCNWVRVKGGEWVAVFRSGLSCSEIRHIQKDILDQIT